MPAKRLQSPRAEYVNAAGANFSSVFEVLGSSLCQPGQRNETHEEGRTAFHSYWHGYLLFLNVKSRQRGSPLNFGTHVSFLTRAAFAAILKSVTNRRIQ